MLVCLCDEGDVGTDKTVKVTVEVLYTTAMLLLAELLLPLCGAKLDVGTGDADTWADVRTAGICTTLRGKKTIGGGIKP